MDAKQSLLENIRNGTFALKTDTALSRLLGLGKRESRVVSEILRSLVREGELLRDSAGRYGTAEQFGAQRGILLCNERGFAFFVPYDGSGDLFIPHRSLNGGMHRDEVLAFRLSRGGGGEVLAVLKRGYSEIVGTVYRDRGAYYLAPDDQKFFCDIALPSEHGRGIEGQKALVHILSFGEEVTGKVVERLGDSGEFFAEELSVIRAHGLREEFPAETLDEAEREAGRPIGGEIAKRRDLRGELIVTVDGEDTRDIDDAISVRKTEKGYELGVHIADVTHYVKRNGALDREAFSRGTSVYFPDRVLPMLPPALSNGSCSLNEGEDRLTLTCLMEIDRSGKVLRKQIFPSVINSRHRMTYDEVQALFDGDGKTTARYPDLQDMMAWAKELTVVLKNARKGRGSVALDVKEARILYKDGTVEIPENRRTLAHEMIEQFMVLANECVATVMTDADLPFVYRVHEPPTAEKAETLLAFLKSVGVTAKFDPHGVTPAVYRDLLASLEGKPVYPLVNRVMLRAMMKARYSEENCGHFGLASECYCHFTSPIRRYPDLCIHRIIKAACRDTLPPLPDKTLKDRVKSSYGSFVGEAARQSSETERNAADAERDVDALYIVRYMEEHIGEIYDASVSGVTQYGLYAELANSVEGFLPLDALPDDVYTYSEERFLLRGNGRSYRLGDPIRVRVDGVDWSSRKVLFGLAPKEGS